MRERRRETRSRAYIGGRASFFREQSTADVLIRNVSASGAKLVVDNNGSFIPDNFKLTIRKWQAGYRVRACWRRHDEIGVEFEQELANNMPNLLSLERRTG